MVVGSLIAGGCVSKEVEIYDTRVCRFLNRLGISCFSTVRPGSCDGKQSCAAHTDVNVGETISDSEKDPGQKIALSEYDLTAEEDDSFYPTPRALRNHWQDFFWIVFTESMGHQDPRYYTPVIRTV
jgi:hypothetical protein